MQKKAIGLANLFSSMLKNTVSYKPDKKSTLHPRPKPTIYNLTH